MVGDPLDEATDVSSLISAKETDRVQGLDRRGGRRRGHGAGRRRPSRTACCAPTVLTGVTPDMEVCRSEVFGPVVGIIAYDDLDDAFALANDTRYGLQAAVFTTDLDTAPCGPPTSSTSAACWSTRCPRSAPTRCPTAASATAATPRRARTTPFGR